MERFREEIRTFANFPTLFMGLVGDDGGLEHYDGKLRFLDAGGHVVADGIDRARLRRLHRARWRTPGPTSRPATTSRWATPKASTAWVRWRG